MCWDFKLGDRKSFRSSVRVFLIHLMTDCAAVGRAVIPGSKASVWSAPRKIFTCLSAQKAGGRSLVPRAGQM